MVKTRIAALVRRVGGGKLMDSPRFRRMIGAPLYSRHLAVRDPGGHVAALPAGKASPAASALPSEKGPGAPAPKKSSPAKQAAPVVKARAAVADPDLSVVIPVYNVEGYVEQTLKSVLSQSFESLEVIVVDDGSTDQSLAKVKRIAGHDLRVRVITKQNAGLGAARNTGIAESTAPFITFVDSDDLVPPGAYALMMQTITASGSDVVIGGVERFNAATRWVPAWVHTCHDEDRIGVTATEFPPILWDVFAWNKIFRRTTWDEKVGGFPEGILYEDQECTGKLFVSDARIDVLKSPVYSWRLRDDGSSITQQKSDMRDLTDRVAVARTMKTLVDGASEPVRSFWYSKVLSDDFYWYMLEVPRADEEFWNLLSEVVEELYRSAPAESLESVPLIPRLMVLAIAEGTRDDFERVLYASQEARSKGQVRVGTDGALMKTAPVVRQLSFDVSEARLRIDPSTLAGEATLRSYAHLESGGIALCGDFRIDGVDPSVVNVSLEAHLVHESRAGDVPTMFELPITSRSSQQALMDSNDALNDYSAGGFCVEVPAGIRGELGSLRLAGVELPWSVQLTVKVAGVWDVVIPLAKRDTRGSAGRLTAGDPDEKGWRLAPMTLEGGGVGFEPLRVTALAQEVACRGDVVDISIALVHGGEVEAHGWQVVASKPNVADSVVAPCHVKNGLLVASLWFPRREALGSASEVEWDVVLQRKGATPLRLASSSELTGDASERFRPSPTGYGYLRLVEGVQRGEVTAVTCGGGDRTLVVSGSLYLDPLIRTQNPSFALVSPTKILHPTEVIYAAGRFEATFSLVESNVDGVEVRVESALYIFQLLTPTRQTLPVSVWLPCSASLVKDFPLDIRGGMQRVLLTRTPSGGALAVDLRAPLRVSESGQFQQNTLISQYSRTSTRGLREAVLFECFAGKSIQDSPLAISRSLSELRPELPQFWTVKDHSMAVPKGATPVVLYSREWYEAVTRSRILVNNNNFPHWFRKHPDQFYVQTWHGTPLKRIGNDVPARNLSLSYRALMRREAGQYWDVLLAQSPWAHRTLASAFGYEGRVVTEGYPRNDALVPSLASDGRRNVVRHHLGLAPGQLAVLYAPTWRDNMKDAQGRYKYQLFLDPQVVRKMVDDDVVFLMRSHSNAMSGRIDARKPYIREVTGYPDVNDLMLAADVLVTDYSSMMFDFVVTGKPIVFLAPDLEEYGESTRGFYLDYRETVPGVVCNTNQEVANVLAANLQGAGAHSRRYERFKELYAPFDDGHVSARVVEALFGAAPPVL